MHTQPSQNLYAYANPSSTAAANDIAVSHDDLLRAAQSIGNLPQGKEHRRERLLVLAPMFAGDGRVPIVIDMRLTALMHVLKQDCLTGFLRRNYSTGEHQIAIQVWHAAAATMLRLDAEVPYFDVAEFVDLAMSLLEPEGNC